MCSTNCRHVKDCKNNEKSATTLHEISWKSSKEYPVVDDIIQNNLYVDDCLTGEESTKIYLQWVDEIELGDFSLEGVSFSKQPQLESLSEYKESISVTGMN